MKKIILSLLGLIAFIPAFAGDSGSILDYNPDAVAREFFWKEARALPDSARPRVGVALSAGGARGYAHVGVLEVLTQAGFPVDAVAGTSMGAIVGALFSAGTSFEKLWDIGRKADIKNITKDANTIGILRLVLSQHLFSSKEAENFISNIIGKIRFDELKIPFSCSAMDIRTGEKITFRSGDVAPAVRASMNLPGLFAPMEYRHRYLVDGGVVDYLPVSSVMDLGAHWVYATVTLGDFRAKDPENVLAYLMQVIDIRGALIVEETAKTANFVLYPESGHINSTDFDKCVEAGELGLKKAYQNLDKAKDSFIFFASGFKK